MADVVSFGQIPKKVPGPSGFSKGLAAVGQVASIYNKGAALKAELATLEEKKRTDNMKYGTKMMDDLAMYKESKSPEEWDAFKQSDHYKQVYGVVADIFPERADKQTKDLFLPTTKDIYKRQIEKMVAGAKGALAQGGEGSLTEGQRKILQMEGMKDEAAEALSILQKNEMFAFYMASPDPAKRKKAGDMLLNTVRQLKDYRGTRNNPLKPSGVDAKDPLGLLQ